MNIINAVTIGKLIAAHREGDEEKFRAYVEFIAEAYEQQGNDRAANIIRSNYTGDYGEGRSFWMKQQNRLHTTRRAGMNLTFWGPVAPIAELQKQAQRKKRCNGC